MRPIPCLMELTTFLMQLRPLQMELCSFANGANEAAWLNVSTWLTLQIKLIMGLITLQIRLIVFSVLEADVVLQLLL